MRWNELDSRVLAYKREGKKTKFDDPTLISHKGCVSYRSYIDNPKEMLRLFNKRKVERYTVWNQRNFNHMIWTLREEILLDISDVSTDWKFIPSYMIRYRLNYCFKKYDPKVVRLWLSYIGFESDNRRIRHEMVKGYSRK